MQPLQEFPAYTPHPLLRNAHLMTLATRLPRPGVAQRAAGAEERLFQTLPDTRVKALCSWQPDPPSAPTLLLVHGLSGHAGSSYMIGTADKAVAAGFNAVRLNVRNAGDTEQLSPRLAHSGLTHDLACVLRELLEEDGLPRIYLAGFSLGGNLVFKLAGELGDGAPAGLAGIVGISPALDLTACAEVVDGSFQNWIYRSFFLRDLKRLLRAKAALFPDRYDLEGLDDVSTISEYDDFVIAPTFGFRDHRDYHERASALPFVPRIRVPALIVQAQDDTVVPFHFFHRPEIRSNPRVALLAPTRGGHCSFIGRGAAGGPGRRDRDRRWAENRVLQFVEYLESLRESDLRA